MDLYGRILTQADQDMKEMQITHKTEHNLWDILGNNNIMQLFKRVFYLDNL